MGFVGQMTDIGRIEDNVSGREASNQTAMMEQMI